MMGPSLTLNTQQLTIKLSGFPNHAKILIFQLSSPPSYTTERNGTLSLPCSPSGCSNFFPGLQCYWSWNINVGKQLRFLVVNISLITTINLMHTSIYSLLEWSIITYSHVAIALYLQSFISMPKPRACEWTSMRNPINEQQRNEQQWMLPHGMKNNQWKPP